MTILTHFITFLATIASLITLLLFYEESLDQLRIKMTGGIPKGFIIFITGTNGVGKTTIANKVAKRIGLFSVVEVDDLRETLRASKELYITAKQRNQYDLLALSSYMSDSIEYSRQDNNNNYIEQCKLLTQAIKAVALRKQKQGLSSVFEGINILPTELIVHDIPAEYILFVNLRVKPPELLKKRLYKKTINIEKRNIYTRNLEKILKTEELINNDFQLIDKIYESKSSNEYSKIHHLTLYNNKSIRKAVRIIVREVRKISKT